MIVIAPYNPEWPREFARLAELLRQGLGDLALRIDHIGFTAVPDLVAKDIIDVQVTVAAFSDQLEKALLSLGFERRRDTNADHRPPQVVGPDSEWEKRYFRPPAHLRPMHLHVRIHNRANQRYALLFRDYLRRHPVAANAYGTIKQQLARYHGADVDAYYDLKDPVCDIIWQAAEEWAQSAGWQVRIEPEGDYGTDAV